MDDYDQLYIDDAIQAITSDADSLSYVLTKNPREPWAYNPRVESLGIMSRMKHVGAHSGCSFALCLRAAEEYIKKNSSEGTQ
jgi:hypothetical protein